MSQPPNYQLTHPPVDPLDNKGLELVEETIYRLRQAKLSYWLPFSPRTYCMFMRVDRAIKKLSGNYPTSLGAPFKSTLEWEENIEKLYHEWYPRLWTRIKKAVK